MKLDRVIAVRNNKTVYRDGADCIKVFDSDYSKADILNEALNQARIEETGIRIPKIKEVLTVDGKWAIVSEYIKGKTLAQLMEEHPEKKAYVFNSCSASVGETLIAKKILEGSILPGETITVDVQSGDLVIR